MPTTDTELGLGKIRLEFSDHSWEQQFKAITIKALRYIADNDPEMFAEMRKQNWTIAPCPDKMCVRMWFERTLASTLQPWAPDFAVPPGMVKGGTVISFDNLDAEAATSDPKLSAVEILASALVHEFVHLFWGVGNDEKAPIECQIKFAKRIGNKNLLAYAEGTRDNNLDPKTNNWYIDR